MSTILDAPDFGISSAKQEAKAAPKFQEKILKMADVKGPRNFSTKLFKVASESQFREVLDDLDKYYGAPKLHEIENMSETQLDLMVKKRDQFRQNGGKDRWQNKIYNTTQNQYDLKKRITNIKMRTQTRPSMIFPNDDKFVAAKR